MVGKAREVLSTAGQHIRNWNAERWHFPDVHDNPKFKFAATVITRIGFFAKTILYGSMAIIAMIAASGVYEGPEGPQTLLGRLATTFGKWVVGFFVAGLFCYSGFAFLFAVFDFDRLGHHAAFPILARFGRIFSAGFYAFIGVAGCEILVSIKNAQASGSSGFGNILFDTTAGQGVVVFLGVVFCVVAIVYLSYIIKPAKFRKELASERMPPWLFYTCVWIARTGAVGRVIFFGAFGVVLIDAVANKQGATVNGTSLFGLEGVLSKIANFSHVLLFITGAFLFVYALWAFVLCLFRRLPAHYNEAEALAAVGMRWRAKRAKKEMQHHKRDAPIELNEFTTVVEMPIEVPVPIEDIKEENRDIEAQIFEAQVSKSDPKGDEAEPIENIEKIEYLPHIDPVPTAHGSPAGFATR